MNKYKVIITVTQDHAIDVYAENEHEAESIAFEKAEELEHDGMLHYHEDGERYLQTRIVHEVTNTDDPFDALN